MPLIQYPWIKADKRLNFASKICSVVQLKDYFCQQFVGNLIEDWNRWNLEDNESNTTISVGPLGRATSSWFDIHICIFLLLKKNKKIRRDKVNRFKKSKQTKSGCSGRNWRDSMCVDLSGSSNFDNRQLRFHLSNEMKYEPSIVKLDSADRVNTHGKVGSLGSEFGPVYVP